VTLRRTPLQNRTPLARRTPLAPGKPLARRVPLKSSPRAGSGSLARPFPPAVAALLDARDAWCVHCGSMDHLQRHHRRGKGIGGDPRPHTQCACNGIRLCWLCHSWAHESGRAEAAEEGLIIPRITAAPCTVAVLVHTEQDGGDFRAWPACDGGWLFDAPDGAA